MKKGRKAERGIQRERGKNEKMIKRKGDREKGTRRDRGRKKRKKKKDKVSLQSLGPGRCIEKKNPPGREGIRGRHQNRCNTQYKSFCGNLILSNFGHSQEGFSSPVPETKCSVSKSPNGRILKSWIPKVTCSQKSFTIGNFLS